MVFVALKKILELRLLSLYNSVNVLGLELGFMPARKFSIFWVTTFLDASPPIVQ